jgi:ABC-type xylose transport system permease subunit
VVKVTPRANKAVCMMQRINTTQILLGVIALLLGSLVYLVDRPLGQTYFVYSSPINISVSNTIPSIFGFIGGSLPDCIHVFSFIMITAGFLFCKRRGYLIICLSWFLIDCAFELSQKFITRPSKIIPDWFAGIPFLENTENYFIRGTFDFSDLAAIAFGTVIAYFVLLTTNRRRVML